MLGFTVSYFIIKFMVIYFIGGGSSGGSTPNHVNLLNKIDTSNNFQLPRLPQMEGPFSPASLDLFELSIRDRAMVENVVTGLVDAAAPLINI
jgi:hypothetical protein